MENSISTKEIREIANRLITQFEINEDISELEQIKDEDLNKTYDVYLITI